MLPLSSDHADLVFSASNVVLIVGCTLAAIGTAGSIWSAGLRERYAAQRLTDKEAAADKEAHAAATQHAELQRQLDESQRRTTAAEARAAAAEAHANDASQRADQATQEAARVARNAAQRLLTREQADAIFAAAAPFRGQPVAFQSVMGDADGDAYKRELAAVLKRAGWAFDDSSLDAQGMFVKVPVGVQVTLNEGEVRAGRVLKSADALVGAMAQVGVLPRKQAFVNPNVPAGVVTIIVGTKPPLDPH